MSLVAQNHGSRFWSLSYQKKVLLAPDQPSLFFGMTPTIKYYSDVFTDDILQSVSYQMKDLLGWCQAKPSFGMTTNKASVIHRLTHFVNYMITSHEV